MKIKNANQNLRFSKNFYSGYPRKWHVPFWILIFGFCFLSFGCDAFVRKFTRKPKKQNVPQEEMVLAPEEYKGPQMSREELYRQYFLFWKSWHDELIESLLQHRSQKKQIGCVDEAIENLNELRQLLNADKQKQLDIYILELKELQEQISKDIYGNSIIPNTQRAESIKRNILRDFSYNKIKNYLI